MITVEKDVKMPPATGSKYPFTEMEIGDSFFLPDNGDDTNTMPRLRGAASAHAKKFGKRFATRAVEGGIRCWRLA